ncbi:baseplate J/gp47 family protein [Phytohabitans houttuyneae]|uniref:Uncharacterized protein n=1 Tax=Phytohabitans houttuyneae TaxID=1076126 RepID=A0A6V8KE11_9ACTN|nr:baseplate J/gp47 family protein [Phytohabitans houttuyneae]GFJ83462.1 hypothetical protein Phou_076420 [Phytohabitans houttuyneae]
MERPPIVHNADARDLVLGVEVTAGSVEIGIAAREYGGKVYEIWQPVGAFTTTSANAKHYLIDRSSGVITFAPALDVRHPVAGAPDPPPGVDARPDRPPALREDSKPVVLAKVPDAGREVRVWYPTGGGPAGNVAADVLKELRTPIPGVQVTGNKEAAIGGRPLEDIESALLRGPYEFFSRQRAVTARDFEVLATAGTTAVGRARAFTRAEVYEFAQPGQVEVVLVPDVPALKEEGYRLSPQKLHEHEEEDLRQRAERDLQSRRALGTSVRVSWAKYKAVSISATVVVRPEEDVDAVRERIHRRLYQTLNPLPTDDHSGWNFGEPLRVSNVYRLLEHAEPGVRYVSDVRLHVDSAPGGRVRAVAVDNYQPLTCYAGSGEGLFRSTNAARGWEEIRLFPGEVVHQIVPAPAALRPGTVHRPGALAAVTRPSAEAASGSRVWLSDDLGDAWELQAQLEARVNDVAWIDRDGTGSLLLATDAGLFEVALVSDATPLQILVDQADADLGFYAVESFVSEHGVPAVALAAQAQRGAYLSVGEGRSGTYQHVGLSNLDTRTLAVQYDGPATVLWVGVGEADPSKAGPGCFRARLFEADVSWQPLQAGWIGGTCRALAFHDRTAIAASHSGGVLIMDTTEVASVWQPVQVNCGLPLRDRARFEPIESIAVMPGEPDSGTPSSARTASQAGGAAPGLYRSGAGRPIRLLLVGGAGGVYRSGDGARWTPSAGQETSDVVTVPDTWLLCSGEHRIEVTTRDASGGD